MTHYAFLPLTGLGLCFITCCAGAAEITSSETRWIKFDTTLKMEAFNLRNQKLVSKDKSENELELEPLLRLTAVIMPDSPVYGVTEIEWKRKIERTSGEKTDKQTMLELNQAYIGLTNAVIPYTKWKLGRWLYRDEREWLMDENLDGGFFNWRYDNVSVDIFAGRVNFWQKDLMDRTTRNNQSVNITGLLTRYDMGDNWILGAYSIDQNNVSNDSFRQTNFGIRSHNAKHKHIRHWLEIGGANGHDNDTPVHGYVLDAGATIFLTNDDFKPRLSLGYAAGSKNYYQTGLHSDEARMGGNTKFKIYGETLNPELSNMQIFTVGIGASLSKKSTLDLVYHDYSQLQIADLSRDKMDLRPRYDRQNTRRLGYGLDLIYGLEPTNNIKLEAKLGVFNPSSRFASDSKSSSPKSRPAYTAAAELEIAF